MTEDGQQPSLPDLAPDVELLAVVDRLYSLDPEGQRTGRVIRSTIDQLLDGARSGRYDYTQLHKTEKTHMGTLVEINMQREFDFADGDATDYRIAGIEVDCKFSQRVRGWEIGPEIVDHLCLVLWAGDNESQWRAGLVRASAEILGPPNRDSKRKIRAEYASRIYWLWPTRTALEENLLLHLEQDRRDRILSSEAATGRRHAQARIFQLCREVQGRIIRRAVIETVGYGLDDPLKRMRGNGGARDALRPEGLLVLGHQDNDPIVAAALGLPQPRKGEFVVARVVRLPLRDSRPAAEIGGELWCVAHDDEPPVAAPELLRSHLPNPPGSH